MKKLLLLLALVATLGAVAALTAPAGVYHLVRNAPTTMQKTALALGGSGEVYTADAVAAYHADHPVNGNDLNIYHIYEATPGGGNG